METTGMFGITYKNKYEMPIILEPKNWKDLERKVAHILKYCNCDVEIDKDLSIARGNTEFDVYAVVKDKYKSICICECKYWNVRVNQDVVDSFRTRLSDAGANLGIIISKKGFQSGCYEKIKFTNIKLFSFEEFIEFYKEEYLLGRAKELAKLVIPLHHYSDPTKNFYDSELEKKDKKIQKQIIKLMCKNDIFTRNIFSLGFYWNNLYLYFDNLIEFYGKEKNYFDNYYDLCEFTIKRINDNLIEIDSLFGKEIRLDSSKEHFIDKYGI